MGVIIMKRFIILTLTSILFLSNVSLFSQEKQYTVMFYNVENLFDVYDDPNILDDEFLPEGPKNWTESKYKKKLSNIEQVLFAVASANKSFPTIIGVSEIENRRVLDDVVSQPKLAKANYQIVHYDSPDARGVDVALFYRPDQFKYLWSTPIKTVIPDRPDFRTRDILAVCGTIDGELFLIFVNHWPSRRGGNEASEYLRVGAAQTLKNYIEYQQILHPDVKIIIMGDLNDDPVDKSIYETLGAKGKTSEVKPFGLFNPFYAMLKAGYGSLGYDDAWNIFDNIIINENLLNATTGELKIQKAPKSKYYGTIFKRTFMVQQEGQYKNYPLRTYSGNTFMGGYSDHFPVFILIGKDK